MSKSTQLRGIDNGMQLIYAHRVGTKVGGRRRSVVVRRHAGEYKATTKDTKRNETILSLYISNFLSYVFLFIEPLWSNSGTVRALWLVVGDTSVFV